MHWGNWEFVPETLTIWNTVDQYEIDLERIHSSAAVLDWIFQIQHKGWADANTMHDLLRAFDDILKPQANYCSNEEDKCADGGKLAREFAERKKTDEPREDGEGDILSEVSGPREVGRVF